jgi:hypothetical protein
MSYGIKNVGSFRDVVRESVAGVPGAQGVAIPGRNYDEDVYVPFGLGVRPVASLSGYGSGGFKYGQGNQQHRDYGLRKVDDGLVSSVVGTTPVSAAEAVRMSG